MHNGKFSSYSKATRIYTPAQWSHLQTPDVVLPPIQEPFQLPDSVGEPIPTNPLPSSSPVNLTPDVVLQPLRTAEAVPDATPAESMISSPDPIDEGLSGSNIDPSTTTLEGLTGQASAVNVTVVAAIAIFAAIAVIITVAYEMMRNPYRPFITGASLSDYSLEWNRWEVLRQSSSLRGRGQGNRPSRRYEARSLERDVGLNHHTEAGAQLQSISNRRQDGDVSQRHSLNNHSTNIQTHKHSSGRVRRPPPVAVEQNRSTLSRGREGRGSG